MADEARAMLDALMGGDRNAPLPSGAAVTKSRDGAVILPNKKKKSCYDHEICPLYCAWNGIDVYELFVNTKSDIGSNPKVVSDSALEEFQQLPKHEQERLGFHHLLFRKLQDLVRMCDRTVARNKEKLVQEKRGKGTAHIDYVTTVDERAVEQTCRTQVDLEQAMQDIQEKQKELENIMKQEAELQERYEEEKRAVAAASTSSSNGADNDEKVKDDGKDEPEEAKDDEKSKENGDKDGETSKDDEAKKEDASKDAIDDSMQEDANGTDGAKDASESANQQEESPLEKEMREVLLKRQRLLFDLARAMQQYAPIQQAKENQMEQLNYLKSDITSDKTVCEVSGNFMSARDADERIAAHYAGKQYVGWKLVRDKLKEMIAEYGRYGPPPGESGRRGPPGGGRGGGDRDGGGGGRGVGDRYGSRDGGGGRWERGGGYNSRGGGYNDDRGGGGYNRGYGGGGDYHRRGGGGGRDRWRR